MPHNNSRPWRRFSSNPAPSMISLAGYTWAAVNSSEDPHKGGPMSKREGGVDVSMPGLGLQSAKPLLETLCHGTELRLKPRLARPIQTMMAAGEQLS